jgi:hypothetical protein
MCRLPLFTVVLALACSSPALASPQVLVVPPQSHVGGLANSQLLGEWWARALVIPAARNPILGNGDPCLRLFGAVVAPVLPGPGSSVTCTARVGQVVYMLGFTTECSNVEEPPFFGDDPAAQRACARANDAEIHTVDLTFGGRTLELVPDFETISPQRTVNLPDGNVLTGNAQTATFAAHGWGATLIPLRPGSVTIKLDVVADSFSGSAEVVLNVVRW